MPKHPFRRLSCKLSWLWCAMMFGKSFIDSPNVNLHERKIYVYIYIHTYTYFSLETCPGTAAVGWDILRHVAHPREFEGVAPLWGRKDVKNGISSLHSATQHPAFLILDCEVEPSKILIVIHAGSPQICTSPSLYVHLTATEGQAAVWGALWIRGASQQWLGVFRGGHWMFSSCQVFLILSMESTPQ